jgi:arylsulfatase A-like enzyme
LGTVLGSVNDLSNTIVVYTSDHGDQLGEHGLPFKGPFMYEPLIRIPLVMAAPSLPHGTTRSDLALSIDVAPTVAALAGLRFPTSVDGRNLAAGQSGRDAVFLEYSGKQHWIEPIRTIRTVNWKLNVYQSGDTELYDLENDPNEIRNAAQLPGYQKIRSTLRDRLDKWRRR